jgi:hydroxypyruvate isomerase
MPKVNRREALAAGAAFAGVSLVTKDARAEDTGRVVKIGRLKQSVSRWCYTKIPDPVFYKAVADMGLTAVDLLSEADWPALKDYGLICSLGWKTGGDIPNGLNDRANHDLIVNGLATSLPRAARAGVPSLIAFFGNRKGIDDKTATVNCVDGLNRVKKIAEDTGVTVVVELLNSIVDHKDYQGDRTAFGVEIIKQVGSPRVKLLYDIYHMQIMEGNIIQTVRENHQWIGHFHTGGVPGRHELDDRQELQWRSVARAIADTGYGGYMAHEFIPTGDPLTSLRQAVALCDV